MKTLLILLFLVINCEANHPNRQWLNQITAFSEQQPWDGNNASPNLPIMPSTPPITTGELKYTLNQFSGNDPVFFFDNTRQIGFGLSVSLGSNSAPGSEITFSTLEGEQGLFRAVTDEKGNLTGNFVIDPILSKINLNIKYNEHQLNVVLDVKNGYAYSQDYLIIAVSTHLTDPDTDGDGIKDKDDHYPNDATRATKINYPTNGFYTVAFEDLYPRQGDADFNDYVVRVRYEEDLDSRGNVKRVRGFYQHVAKGAGYNHILKLTLPNVPKANYSLKNFTSTDILESEVNVESVSPSSISLLAQSNLTLGNSNTGKNQSFQFGKKSEIEFILETPISKSILGSVPYDLFISVINTNQEIHFAGRKFDQNGKDLYLDETSFPWAIMVPGNFKWPYERNNIHVAYPKFESWYKSLGGVDVDWYNFPVLEQVFPSE